MKNFFLPLYLLCISLTGFSKTIIITNWGAKFSPADTIVNLGDTIKFNLMSTHDVVEVDQQAYDAEENVPLAGGFTLPKGGGTLLTANLSIGTHYYICAPHITLGMKGTITINGANGIAENQKQNLLSIYPVPAIDFIIVKGNQLTGVSYSILDENGRLVMTGKLESNETQISIRNLAWGMYFFQAEGDKRKAFSIVER